MTCFSISSGWTFWFGIFLNVFSSKFRPIGGRLRNHSDQPEDVLRILKLKLYFCLIQINVIKLSICSFDFLTYKSNYFLLYNHLKWKFPVESCGPYNKKKVKSNLFWHLAKIFEKVLVIFREHYVRVLLIFCGFSFKRLLLLELQL